MPRSPRRPKNTRDHFLARNRRAPISFTASAEGFVYDEQTEGLIRGIYRAEDTRSREPLLLFAFLFSEALSQTSLEAWERPNRERSPSRVARETDGQWHAPRVEAPSLDTFRIELVQGAHEDPKRRVIDVTFTSHADGVTSKWNGLREGEPRPTLLVKEASNVDEVRTLAHNTIRTAMGFLGQLDPLGRGYLETERSNVRSLHRRS